jgi:hypothetical protein
MSQSHAMFVESKDKVLNWVYDMAFVADPTSAPNDFNISVWEGHSVWVTPDYQNGERVFRGHW